MIQSANCISIGLAVFAQWPTHTDTQTTLSATSVAVGRIHAMRSMRHKRTKTVEHRMSDPRCSPWRRSWGKKGFKPGVKRRRKVLNCHTKISRLQGACVKLMLSCHKMPPHYIQVKLVTHTPLQEMLSTYIQTNLYSAKIVETNQMRWRRVTRQWKQTGRSVT